MSSVQQLDELDRQIVAALQVNGRASWSTIARALDEPLSTVTRRGNALLQDGTVKVIALPNLGPTALVEIQCEPHHLLDVCREISNHPGTVFAAILASPGSILAEVHELQFDLATMTLQQIPQMRGVTGVSASPILRYFTTHPNWRPFPLRTHEIDTIGPLPVPVEILHAPSGLTESDSAIIDLLSENGRAGVAELAAAASITEPTARKRLLEMFEHDLLTIRTVVSPSRLGLPLEAYLEFDCLPAEVDALGQQLARLPECRHAAQVIGTRQVSAQIVTSGPERLREILAMNWGVDLRGIRSSLITAVCKRSGVLTPTSELF